MNYLFLIQVACIQNAITSGNIQVFEMFVDKIGKSEDYIRTLLNDSNKTMNLIIYKDNHELFRYLKHRNLLSKGIFDCSHVNTYTR